MVLTQTQKESIKRSFKSGSLEILSVSPELEIEYKPIQKVWKNYTPHKKVVDLITDNTSITLTDDHILFGRGEKERQPIKAADALGQLIITENNTEEAIREIKEKLSQEWMYDITVKDNHSLLVNGLFASNSPDRNYHFRPPTRARQIQNYTETYDYIWEDEELWTYILMGMDLVNASPPQTFWALSDQIASPLCGGATGTAHPLPCHWQTVVLLAAAIFAARALQMNWTADEFSCGGEEKIRIYFEDEDDYEDISLEELYDIINED